MAQAQTAFVVPQTSVVSALPIPKPVARYKGLTPGAKLVYAVLFTCQEGGFAPVQNDTIGRVCAMQPAAVLRYTHELIRRGFVCREFEPGGPLGFRLLPHPVFSGDQS